jgi:hypothetical protein
VTVRAHVHDDHVDVELDGIDRVLALRDRVLLAMDDIESARVVPVDGPRGRLSWRAGGAYWPGTIATGTFLVKDRPGARQFWSVYRDDEVLEIATRLERPAFVVLQLPDRHDIAWFIGERLARR